MAVKYILTYINTIYNHYDFANFLKLLLQIFALTGSFLYARGSERLA
jgi:hypothetical protein